MIEHLVDNVIATLLGSISGLKVVVGMQDNLPALETPYCVVYSSVQSVQGRIPIYELLTTVEYESISGQDMVSDVDTAITAIDAALLTPPAELLMYPLRTQQDIGDRRRNVREFKVFVIPGLS
jgi:hypothetical protein